MHASQPVAEPAGDAGPGAAHAEQEWAQLAHILREWVTSPASLSQQGFRQAGFLHCKPRKDSLGSQASHSQVPLDLLQIVVLPAEHAPQRGEHSQCISNAVPSVISFTMCQLA